MRNVPVLAINALSVASNQTSAVIDGQGICQFSLQSVATGATPTGTLKVQVSNDICPAGNLPSQFVPSNWADHPSATLAVSAVGSLATLTYLGSYGWYRVVWTTTSGTGTISAEFHGMGA